MIFVSRDRKQGEGAPLREESLQMEEGAGNLQSTSGSQAETQKKDDDVATKRPRNRNKVKIQSRCQVFRRNLSDVLAAFEQKCDPELKVKFCVLFVHSRDEERPIPSGNLKTKRGGRRGIKEKEGASQT